MSYELIYDKQFVKVGENLFLPMMFGGSSNCIQYDKSSRGRRERSWYNDSYITNGKKIGTKDEILARIDEIRADYIKTNEARNLENPEWADKYDDKHFGYFASLAIGGSTIATTFGMYKGLYVTGMAKALTIDQLKEENVHVNFHIYNWADESKKKAAELNIEYLDRVTIESETHFFETLEKFRSLYDGTGISWYIGFNEHNLEGKMKRIRQKYFPKSKVKKEFDRITQDHFFTVTFNWDGITHYFVKRTRRGVKYTHYPYHQFGTEKEANVLKNRLKNKLELTVLRVDKMATVSVPKKNLTFA